MKPNCPRDFSIKIQSTSETAFQRSIWMSHSSQLNNTIVTWIDIELPVNVSGNPRGKCLDLIGIDNVGRYVLCELKFGSPGNGNPSKALKQIQEYADFITLNASILVGHHKRSEDRWILNWKIASDADKRRLIIAGNDEYWNYWISQRGFEIPKSDNVECYTLPIPSNHYICQKGNSSRYTPTIVPKLNVWKML